MKALLSSLVLVTAAGCLYLASLKSKRAQLRESISPVETRLSQRTMIKPASPPILQKTASDFEKLKSQKFDSHAAELEFLRVWTEQDLKSLASFFIQEKISGSHDSSLHHFFPGEFGVSLILCELDPQWVLENTLPFLNHRDLWNSSGNLWWARAFPALLKANPDAALDIYFSLDLEHRTPSARSKAGQSQMLESVIAHLIGTDPGRAVSFFTSLPRYPRSFPDRALVRLKSIDLLDDYIDLIQQCPMREDWYKLLTTEAFRMGGPNAALDFYAKLQPHEERNRQITFVIFQVILDRNWSLQQLDQITRITLNSNLSKSDLESISSSIISRTSWRDLAKSNNWLDSLAKGPFKESAIAAFAQQLKSYDHEAAEQWAGQVENPQRRAEILEDLENAPTR